MAYIKYGNGYVKFGDGFVKIYGDLDEYVEPTGTTGTTGTFSAYLNPAYINTKQNVGAVRLDNNITAWKANDYWAYQAIEVEYPLDVTSYSYTDFHGTVFGKSSAHSGKPFFAGLVFATDKTNPISGTNVTYSAINKTGAMIFGDGSGLPDANLTGDPFAGGNGTRVPSAYFEGFTMSNSGDLPYYHTVQPTTPFTLEPDKRYYFPVMGNNAKDEEIYMQYQTGTLPSIPERTLIIIPSGEAKDLIDNQTASINVAQSNTYHGPAGFLELNLSAV